MVLDHQTALTWQREVSRQTTSWDDATTYCEQLRLAGTGWQVPGLSALESLVVEGSTPAIDSTAFPDTPGFAFWTSTTNVLGDFWVVNFADGSRDTQSRYALTANIRCVRLPD